MRDAGSERIIMYAASKGGEMERGQPGRARVALAFFERAITKMGSVEKWCGRSTNERE